MLEKFPDWAAYLEDRQSNEVLQKVRKHTKTGRSLGSTMFIEALESLSGRSLKPSSLVEEQLSKLSPDTLGRIRGANVTVNCVTDTFLVGGSVSGAP